MIRHAIAPLAIFVAACGGTTEASPAPCGADAGASADAGPDAAPPDDPCIETPASIGACARELCDVGWTAIGCVGSPPKKRDDAGQVVTRPSRDGCAVTTTDRDMFITCCP